MILNLAEYCASWLPDYLHHRNTLRPTYFLIISFIPLTTSLRRRAPFKGQSSKLAHILVQSSDIRVHTWRRPDHRKFTFPTKVSCNKCTSSRHVHIRTSKVNFTMPHKTEAQKTTWLRNGWLYCLNTTVLLERRNTCRIKRSK